MSRLKRFAHSLVSGYVLLGANMLYTLASIPLALHYLSKDQFGLWTTTATIGGFVAMVDFGLSASASRVLIDYKDRRTSGEYGSVVQTGALVGFTQGSLVMLVGVIVSLFIGPALKVEASLQRDFTWLLIGQCVIIGIGFYARILSHILTAHQRYDVANYTSAILLATSFGVMWFCFGRGIGVFSVIWAQASGILVGVAVNFWACARLKFLPARGTWGRPSWRAFRELFAFGRDFFLFAIGSQLVNASQTLLLTRFFGLETAAVWSICTRVYLLLSQLISRIFDYSSAAFAEMMVLGETPLLQRRFREVVILSSSLSAAAAVMLALCNSSFVSVWTSGRINSLNCFPADIREPAVLANKLVQQTDLVSQFLWANISPPAQVKIQALLASKAGEDDLKILLAHEFNAILNGTTIYERGRFAQINLSSESKSQLVGSRQPTEQLRLNRYLLEDAYPGQFANSRKAHWSPLNDLLLGLWLIVSVFINLHTGLAGQTKIFGFMRFLPFIEGSVFIVLTVLLIRFGGVTLMLVLSILCSAAFRLPYGLNRTREYFQLPVTEVMRWHRTVLRLLLLLAPVGMVVWWGTRGFASSAALAIVGCSMGLWTGFVLLRFGLSPALKAELARRAPAWARPVLAVSRFARE